ncbi:DUF5134 domain-containing protein [Streptomyces sp. ET3-23]|uniref:DUF5134 domain-containing protein n=1 Tax=Streptomyces sp. ET3-23 TaxID=2885643 RepID=UPI001D117868|nr:DUF5134 domain-containing protein [Streptomyces sp. ET3-23]MCC2275242.1 DUF5134 domain-containing protein [Streptomyces sp. ET3-23]
MHGSPLVGWLLVAIAGGTGLLCLLRARVGGPTAWCGQRTACAEGVMGFGMAVMAVPRTALDAHRWGPPVFVVLFVALALRSVFFARGELHRVHHAFEAAAMAYMAAVMSPGGMPGGSMEDMHHDRTMGLPAVNALLAVYFAVYVVVTGAHLLMESGPAVVPARDGVATAPGGMLVAPAVEAACRLSLAIGMLVMVLMM